MSLYNRILMLLKQHDLSPNVLKDQHFCINQDVLRTIIKSAQLEEDDVIVEIGPGLGILTLDLASKIKKVIAIEIDEQLKPVLESMPKNVELIFGNALEILPTRNDFNKIVSNLPYQICEPVLQYLTTAKHVERAVLTVPRVFALKAQEHPIFSAFFTITIVEEVPKEAFYPQPRVKSAVITVVPRKEWNDGEFIIRKLHLQRDKKLRNGLRDALIDLYELKEKKLTKKQASEMIDSFKLSEKVLDTLIAVLPLEVYGKIGEKLEDLVS